MPPLFEPTGGGGYVANAITRGPWDERMMHGGPPAALLAREIEQQPPGREDMVVARLTVEFLGAVPIGPVKLTSAVVKPGRRLQLVDATLDAAGRRVCMARAVRLRGSPLPAAAAKPAHDARPLSPPDDGTPMAPLVVRQAGMFHPDACEIRHVGGEIGSGAVAVWVRLRVQLVAGEAPSPLARVAAAADFANGVSWILPVDEWLYVNSDLTIHLHREAQGEWIGLDARSSIGAMGIGQATGVLYDLHGPVGTCAQSLFVEPRYSGP